MSARPRAPRLASSTTWMENAACRGEDVRLFIGPDNEPSTVREIREQKAVVVCLACPVRHRCLESAIEHREVGVWGGLTDAQRQAERRRRMRRANAA